MWIAAALACAVAAYLIAALVTASNDWNDEHH